MPNQNRVEENTESSQETSFTTFVLRFIPTVTYKKIIRVVRKLYFYPADSLVDGINLASGIALRQPVNAYVSLAENVRGLTSTANALHYLSANRYNRQPAHPVIVELDDNAQELSLSRQPGQRSANNRSSLELLNPFLDDVIEPRLFEPSVHYNYRAQRAINLVNTLDDFSRMAVFFVGAPELEDLLSLSSIASNLAIAAAVLIIAHKLDLAQDLSSDLAYSPMPIFSPSNLLNRPRPAPQPPNQHQLFAQNYYRPAAPRPLPPTPRNDQRLAAVNFPLELIPEEFTCALMSTVMDNPVRLPVTNQICDGVNILEAHARKPENPFNRQPMNASGPNSPTPELALRDKIGRYVDKVVAGVNERKATLSQQTLSMADYKLVNENALSRLAAPSPQSSVAEAPSPSPRRS